MSGGDWLDERAAQRAADAFLHRDTAEREAVERYRDEAVGVVNRAANALLDQAADARGAGDSARARALEAQAARHGGSELRLRDATSVDEIDRIERAATRSHTRSGGRGWSM